MINVSGDLSLSSNLDRPGTLIIRASDAWARIDAFFTEHLVDPP